MDWKPAWPVPEWTEKHAKWLHELMIKESASVIATCSIDTEEEYEGYVNKVKCDGREDSESRQRTPNASWPHMERAGEGEMLQ
jgi:hypothetical protein